MKKLFQSFMLSFFLFGACISASAQSSSTPSSGGTPVESPAAQVDRQTALRVLDAVKGNYQLPLEEMVVRYDRGECRVICNWQMAGHAEYLVEMKGNPLSIILLEDGL